MPLATNRATGDTLQAADINAIATEANAIRVKVDRSMPSVLDLGVNGDNSNDSVAMQAAMNNHVALRIPGGNGAAARTYRFDSSLTRPATLKHLEGDGSGTTTLSFPTDVGAGNHAIDGPEPYVGRRYQTWKGFKLIGPPGSTIMGTAPSEGYGIKDPGFSVWDDVRIERFKAGVRIRGDHSYFTHCEFINNYYNAYWNQHPSYVGNHSFEHCNLGGSMFASVAVSGGTDNIQCEFRDVHFGWGPYGVYGESAVAGTMFLWGCLFDHCYFEVCGNAAIEDEDATRLIYQTRFHHTGTSGMWTPEYRIASRSIDHAIRCDAIQETTIDGDLPFLAGSTANPFGGAPLASVPAVAGIRTRVLRDFQWRDAGLSLDRYVAGGKPLVKLEGSPTNIVRSGGEYYRQTAFDFRKHGSATALTAGDLVKANVGTGTLLTTQPWPTLGVALQGGANTEAVVIARRGPVSVKHSGTVAAIDHLKPDAANIGKVVTAAAAGSGKTLDTIGHAEAAGNGTVVQMMLY